MYLGFCSILCLSLFYYPVPMCFFAFRFSLFPVHHLSFHYLKNSNISTHCHYPHSSHSHYPLTWFGCICHLILSFFLSSFSSVVCSSHALYIFLFSSFPLCYSFLCTFFPVTCVPFLDSVFFYFLCVVSLSTFYLLIY